VLYHDKENTFAKDIVHWNFFFVGVN